ncbi:MAG: hypothetical protein QXN37_00055 [Candidatus Anstonellaceae archaeon]
MKRLALFLLALFSSFFAFSLEDFVPENMSYKVENFTYDRAVVQAVVVEGQLYAFLENGNPVLDIQKIQEMLRSYFIWQGYSPTSILEFEKIHSDIVKIKDARKPGENQCRVFVGTDRNPCTNFDECQKACYSVTSMCQPMAFGGGKPFIYAILDFENQTKMLDAAYEKEEQAYQQLSSNPSRQTVEAYLLSLQEINKQATKASSNQLFDYYFFCFTPDYALPNITAAQLAAQKAYANLSRFFEIENISAQILNLTKYGMMKVEYLQSLRQPPQNTSFVTQNYTTNITQSKPMQSKLETEEKYLNPAILIVASIFAFAVVILVVFAFFRLRRRL